jgi:hypothetical protein
MKYRNGIVWSVGITVISLSLMLGGLFAVSADEPALPAPDREIEELISEKLGGLSTMEQTGAAPLSGTDTERVPEEPLPSPPVRPLLVGHVDCDAGASVNRALSIASARRVILHLSGTCRESVVVDRRGVTLTGSLSGTAVIDPPDEDGIPIGPAVYALVAHELMLEDLTLTGATYGLDAHASRRMQLTRVNAVENQVCPDCPWGAAMGIHLNGSEAEIVDSNLSSNNAPLWVDNHSTAIVMDTVMEDNNSDGPFALTHSYLEIAGCTLRNNGLGPQAVVNSFTWVRGSTVESPGYAGWSYAVQSSHLWVTGTEIYGNVAASRGSHLQLGGGVSLDGTIWVLRSSGAQIETAGSIRGQVLVQKFSDAYIDTAQAIDGSVVCSDRSRATCTTWPTGGVDGCD